MTWITRFLREPAGWYGQLSLPRQMFLGLALVVFPILLALAMLTEALVARLLRSRRR
jgi:ABC-type tungstate transport system substrate-binding protein